MPDKSEASWELRVVTCEKGNSKLMITDSNKKNTLPVEITDVNEYLKLFGEVYVQLVKNPVKDGTHKGVNNKEK